MSGPWEKYQEAETGPWEKYAAQTSGGQAKEPAAPREAAQDWRGNLMGGIVRGAAGSIGSTLLAPVDALARAAGVQNSLIGRTDRRAAIDGALYDLGADKDSLAFGAGKFLTEIAGTAGVGGAIAKPLIAAAKYVPALSNALTPLAEAISTAGFKAGGLTGLPAVGVRAIGGGINGAVSAGMVDPESVGTGAAIGAALPVVAPLFGMAGHKVGNMLRGPEQTPELAAAVTQARRAGYVIPPTQARPSLGNRLLEGFSGKITTAQNASARNQEVTKDLATKALGLANGTTITPEVLDSVRKSAGQAYAAIGQTGTVTPPATYSAALDAIEAPFIKAAQGFPNAKPSPVLELVESLRSPSFDAAAAVEKVTQLRTAADDAFRTGNTDIGRASKAAAKAMEDALEAHLQTLNQPQLLQQFRDARKLIAKSYTVQKALNPASGGVDARKLGAELKRGKPLTDELKQAAEFGLQFPKAAQTVEGMGSLPQTSPLDWIGAGTLSGLTSSPFPMVLGMARPAARATALSPLVQNRLVQSARTPNALMDPALQGFYRIAPLIGTDQ